MLSHDGAPSDSRRTAPTRPPARSGDGGRVGADCPRCLGRVRPAIPTVVDGRAGPGDRRNWARGVLDGPHRSQSGLGGRGENVNGSRELGAEGWGPGNLGTWGPGNVGTGIYRTPVAARWRSRSV